MALNRYSWTQIYDISHIWRNVIWFKHQFREFPNLSLLCDLQLTEKIYKLLSRSVMAVTKTYLHCFITTLRWLMPSIKPLLVTPGLIFGVDFSPLGENRCETGLLNWAFHTLLHGYVNFIWCTFTSQERRIATLFHHNVLYIKSTIFAKLRHLSSMLPIKQFFSKCLVCRVLSVRVPSLVAWLQHASELKMCLPDAYRAIWSQQ